MTALTTTRAELRRRIGFVLGDITPLIATAVGTTTRLTDTVRLGNSIERPNGRDIVFTNGANLGTVRRVTTSDMTAGTVDFAALGTAVALNDTAEMYDFRGKGWRVPEYDNAINMAIDAAWPLFGVPVTVSAAAVFDATTTTIDVPSGIDQVESVEYQDSGDIWQIIPQASSRYGDGWSVEADGSDIVIRGAGWRARVSGMSVRLVGYTRATTLTADTDTTPIAPEWIVAKAASIMCLSATGRDTNNYNKGLLFREDADKLLPSIRTRRKNRPVMVAP